MLGQVLQFVSCLLVLHSSLLGAVEAKKITKNDLRARQAEAAKRWSMQPNLERRATGVKNITFSNPRASGTLSPRPPVLKLTIST